MAALWQPLGESPARVHAPGAFLWPRGAHRRRSQVGQHSGESHQAAGESTSQIYYTHDWLSSDSQIGVFVYAHVEKVCKIHIRMTLHVQYLCNRSAFSFSALCVV